MFAPVTRHPAPTFNRTPEADRIVERNMARPNARPSSMLADVSAIQFLASMLRNQPASGSRQDVLDLFRSIGIVRIGTGDDEDEDGSRAVIRRRGSDSEEEEDSD